MAPFSLKAVSIPSILLSSSLLFLLLPPFLSPSSSSSSSSHSHRRRLLLLPSSSSSSSSSPPCSSVLLLPPDHRCLFSRSHCSPSAGLLNYSSLHFCFLRSSPVLSLPSLSLLLLLLFHLLARTASASFSPAVSLLSARLRLSPSMAAVTLLALGNGAPDLFASIAALRSAQTRTGLAAVVSAGAFVSAFVVGAVSALSPASPFPLDPSPFIRDVFFYIVAASAVFYVYLSAEIFLWQAVGMVLFYVFFVALVFWMDCRPGEGGEDEMIELPERESEGGRGNGDARKRNGCGWGLCRVIGKVSAARNIVSSSSMCGRSEFYF